MKETYFFVIVFTIVFVISIFFQTRFKGHTRGTNLSAVMLVAFNLTDLNRLYCYATGISYTSLLPSALGLLGIVVYSRAQSDPLLIERKPEPDELEPGDQVRSLYIWGNSAVFLTAGIVLCFTGLFDTRDMYMLIVGLMAYTVAFKSIQANVYSTLLLDHQMEENQRLEQKMAEKTAELREANEQLERISETDVLTGLHNRRYGMKYMQSRAADEPLALLLMDMDHFKQVNDTYGHDAGDEVLREIGRRLKSVASEHVEPIRLGGDEFMVLAGKQEGEELRDTAAGLAEKICSIMDEKIKITEAEIQPSICIGIALCPEHADNIDELYNIADEAMYSIKHKKDGSSWVLAG